MMALSTKTADRFSFGIFYVVIGVLILWAGFRVLNSGLEVRFLKEYLIQWDISLQSFSARQGAWPVFSNDNHVAYMEALTRRMARAGIQPPNSNTVAAYRYRIERLAGQTEKVFVLGLPDRSVLYGLSRASVQHIDRAADRQSDLKKGHFQGFQGKDNQTYIGNWKL